MATFNEIDTTGLGLGNGRLHTFRTWHQLYETPIGNLSSQTFRPTEAEKLVLLNIDDMVAQGRTVTQQDAINVPEEKLEDAELSKDQLESAYKQLISVRLIQVEPDQTVVISSEGAPVVEELKKAEAQKAEQEPEQSEQPQGDMGMGGQMGGGVMPGAELGGMQGGAGPMEGVELIRFCNDMSKLLEEIQDVFVIYKVSSRTIPEVYYGYCRGTTDEDMRTSFMNHKSGEEGRGVVKLIQANGGPEGLEFEVVDRVEDEERALLRRNEYREQDDHSVTGPSFFPATLYKSVQKKHPDVFKKHQQRRQQVRAIRSATSAAEVYNKDGFSEQDIEQAMEKFGRNQVVDDLYGMSPGEFSKKYNIQVRMP